MTNNPNPTGDKPVVMPELLPCPFCGSPAELSDLGDPQDDSMVNCTNQRGCGMQQIARFTPEGAVAAWNTRHREQDTLSREGREADKYRILKDALFALERQSAHPVSYGGVLTKGGRRAWIAYGLFDEGERPVFSPPASEGRDVGREEPWPGCFADLQRRRVMTLAKLGLMLSLMAGGEAAEVVGYDAADLYAEVLMALAIEDAEDTDIALEVARDHPEGDILTALSNPPAPEQPDMVGELVEALEPFAKFADTFIDEEGWSGPMKTERIVDWFGPSDFRRARDLVTKYRSGDA